MKTEENQLQNVTFYARWGEIAVNVAVTLFFCYLVVFCVALALPVDWPAEDLINELELNDVTTTLTKPQEIVGALFFTATDFLGIFMLLTARALFRGFRHTGVFTPEAVTRLRRIGLIIIALAPVSILSTTLANFILTLWITGNSVSISITLDDTDVYAIVIGLVITAVSQVMLEAVRLSEENRAFV